eukprot:CAMPEP_0183356846 /NCGR_PEP_ID=MMETSP0164_2-20130417/45226_1 /TAXON_ID=221442 /ORGANISM="Coccolithus pelagicus ssp braarudi, Strain PLY182g" /LENGTH=141 /DNA_ID=CAMNT_0025530349 /DNA_START=164 /DNA_END=590 /DNA_ORIENTATION=-
MLIAFDKHCVETLDVRNALVGSLKTAKVSIGLRPATRQQLRSSLLETVANNRYGRPGRREESIARLNGATRKATLPTRKCCTTSAEPRKAASAWAQHGPSEDFSTCELCYLRRLTSYGKWIHILAWELTGRKRKGGIYKVA